MKKDKSFTKLAASIRKARPVFTVNNQKGGVGKTTCGYHLVELCLEMGLRVATIDNDPQGNFTSVLLSHNKVSEDHLESKKLLRSADLYQADLPEGFSLYQPRENLFVIPGTLALEDVDQLPLECVMNFRKNVSETIANKVDIVLVDTPPTYGNRQLAGQLACTNLVMPMEIDAFSLDGLESAITRINHIFNELLEEETPHISLIPNRCNTRSSTYHKNIGDIQNSGFFVAEPIIARQPIADAISEGNPVWNYHNGNARNAAKNVITSLTQILGQVA